MDRHKLREMITVNWSDSSNDTDAVNWIQIVYTHILCRITWVNLD